MYKLKEILSRRSVSIQKNNREIETILNLLGEEGFRLSVDNIRISRGALVVSNISSLLRSEIIFNKENILKKLHSKGVQVRDIM